MSLSHWNTRPSPSVCTSHQLTSARAVCGMVDHGPRRLLATRALAATVHEPWGSDDGGRMNQSRPAARNGRLYSTEAGTRFQRGAAVASAPTGTSPATASTAVTTTT